MQLLQGISEIMIDFKDQEADMITKKRSQSEMDQVLASEIRDAAMSTFNKGHD